MKKILVFVPVAGKATRVYPLSLEIPKHQFPINGKSLESYITEKALGLPETEYDITVYKNTEDPPKGTAWSLIRIPEIKSYDQVIVWYGDIYSEVDLRGMLLFHENMNSNLTILCRKATNETKKGLFDLKLATQQKKYYQVIDENGKVRATTRCLASAKELSRYWENRTMVKMSVNFIQSK